MVVLAGNRGNETTNEYHKINQLILIIRPDEPSRGYVCFVDKRGVVDCCDGKGFDESVNFSRPFRWSVSIINVVNTRLSTVEERRPRESFC